MPRYTFLLFALATPLTALAQDTTWTATINDFWGITGNWSAGLPSTTDSILFDGTASEFTVDVGAENRAVAIMTVDSATPYSFEDGTPGQTLSFEDLIVLDGSGHTFTVNLFLDAPPQATMRLASGTSAEVSSIISGSSSLLKDGAGSLTLSRDNSYSGGTTVLSGTLQLGNGGTTGSIIGDIANEADLVFNRSDNPIYAGVISGAGDVTQAGTGSLTFSGANTYSGATNITSGELIIANGNFDALENSAVTVDAVAQLTIPDTTGAEYRIGSLAGAGPADFGQADLRVDFDNSSVTYAGTMTFDLVEGTGSIEKFGTGEWTLTGPGQTIGRITVESGAVHIDGASGYLGSFDVRAAEGTIRGTSSADEFVSLSTSGILTISGPSTVVDAESTNASGGSTFTVEDGASLSLNDVFQQSAGGSFIVDQASLSLSQFATNNLGTISLSDPLGGTALTMGDNSATTSTFAGIIQDHSNGPGSVVKTGTSSIRFLGANTYTGPTTIQAGELIVGESNVDALANSAVTINGGAQLSIPDTVGDVYTLGSLAGGGIADFGLGELDVGQDNSSTTFSGALIFEPSGTLAQVEKYGIGTWTLTGSGHQISSFDAREGSVVVDGASGSFGPFRVLGENTDASIVNTTTAADFAALVNLSGMLTISGPSTVVETQDLIFNGGGTNPTYLIEDGAVLNIGGFFQQTDVGLFVVDQSAVSFPAINPSFNEGLISISDPLGGVALTIGMVGAADSSFAGIIQDHSNGPGSVVKTGDNSITFSGANTYSGATSILGGELVIDDANYDALLNSAVTIGSGAQLRFADSTGGNYNLASLAGSGILELEQGDLDFGTDNASTTFSGTLTRDAVNGFGEVRKLGSGTWTAQHAAFDIGSFRAEAGFVVLNDVTGQLGTLGIDISSQVTIQNTLAATDFITIQNGGTLHVTGPATVVTVGDIQNGQTLVVDDGATLTASDELGMDTADTIVVDQGSLTFRSFQLFGSDGSISISDPAAGPALTIGGDNLSSRFFHGDLQDHTSGPGSLTKVGTNFITLDGNNTYTGITTIEGGTLFTDNLAGSLLSTGGTFSPGPGPNLTTVGGGYTQQSGGTLLLEIAGTTAGTNHDLLTLGGASDLAGTIEVQLLNGFVPSDGDQFTVITTTATLTDSGVTFVLPALAEGLDWVTTFDGNSLVLAATAAPTADDQAVTTDEDAALTIVLTGSDPGSQPLTFSIESAPSDGSLGSITPLDDTSAEVTYTPDPDFNGDDSFTFLVNDGIVDSAAGTVSITIDPMNDAPSFTPGGDVSEIEDGDYDEPWANSISPGPADESDQMVTFSTMVTSNPGLFAAGPSIDPSGVLSFTPTVDTTGSATIEVVAMDDGGTANGGQDMSAPVNFIIDVIAAADLTIEKTSGSFFTEPGGAITYTIVVTNVGPSDVSQASVLDIPPARLGNVAWTCMPGGSASCNSSGSVEIDELIDLPEGSSVIFTLNANLLGASNDPITNTASVSVPAGVLELAPGNNSDSDTDLVGLFADSMESIER